MTAGDISVSSTHRHSHHHHHHPHNLSHPHSHSRHLNGDAPATTMAHHRNVASPRQSLEYLDASQSPVPSLTSATLRSSSVSSSVNSLSPDAHQVTTPRDLLPQFRSVSNGYHAPMGSVANGIEADGIDYKKRRREDESDEALPVPQTQTQQQPQLEQPESKKRRKTKTTTRRLSNGERRPLTGSTDFVKRFGLSEMYDEFVRPYVVEGQVRRTMPDLAASDYLRGVKGIVACGAGSPVLDLVTLVKAPPKSEFSRLELLPMASIRAAFAIGNDKRTKLAQKHQGADEQPKSQQPRHANGNSGNHRHRPQHAVPASQPPKATR
ncbi:hypothetical protein GGI20_005307 [Coemansia sp. BCRC 34301]|nr:hypothetical protein GGI20_005307 [Coemansia sp. BCRC 34301]